ncbi:MAG: glutaminase [Brachybacterium sp.]|nr:glutaminase [Brachybacterium sp.]
MRSPVPEYVHEILDLCAAGDRGELADYIPQLAAVNPELLAVALCTPDGTIYSAGDTDHRFTIQSISKPFAYALALEDHGKEEILRHVDVEPSGDAFNSISLEEGTGRPENPMINIGAITVHSLIGEERLSGEERADRLIAKMGDFAGRTLEVDEAVFASELEESWRNLALANLAKAVGTLRGDPAEAVRGYIRCCAVTVDVEDLAMMAITLASDGINPRTGEQVVPEWVARQVLSVMTSCGMYDAAGDWLSTVGIPAKSGVAGGILGALPGQVGIGTFSPRLDRFGNSVRGVRMFERLSNDMGLHLMRTPPPSIDAIGQRSRTRDGRRLIRLQGGLTFATAELALRHFQHIPTDDTDVVVDFTLVPRIEEVGARMIHEGLERLANDGHSVILVDPHGRVAEAGDMWLDDEDADSPEYRPEEYIDRVVGKREEI